MANIVGSNMDRTSELQRAKKEMWNHKPFTEIYDYTNTIGRVKELSKMPVTGMIEQFVKEWQEIGMESVAMQNLPDMCGKVFRFRRHALGRVPEDDTSNPRYVCASVIEIADTSQWTLGPDQDDGVDTLEFMHGTLQDFITMGLYPLVHRPVTPRNINESMLRNDSVIPSSSSEVGVIVGTVEMGEGPEYRCGAIVMWDPDFTNEYGEGVFGTGCGVLKLRQAIQTPDLWKDVCKDIHVDDAFFAPSFYTPVFELSLHMTEVNRVVFCPTMTDMVNECFISGRVNLDFANFLQEKLRKTTNALVEMSKATGIKVDEDMNLIFPNKTTGAEKTPSTATSAPEPEPAPTEPDVPVEDAMDDWGKFMRGLDEAAPVDRPRDVYTGMLAEALNPDDDPIYG